MKLREIFTRFFILPLSDIALKRSISKHLNFLEKSQWWSKEQLVAYQNQRLKKLIAYSYENVPFYRELLDNNNLKPSDIQTVEDLKKIPIVTKSDLIQNFPSKITAKNIKDGTYYRASSSGSTGEPLQYYLPKEAYSFNIAAGLRAWNWMGYKLGDKYIKISQNQRSTKEKKLQDRLLNNQYLFLKDIDDEHLDLAIEKIKNVEPQFIRCYPDPLEFLADKLNAEGEVLKLKAIATTGNMLHKHTREKIEKAFSCKIYDAYSCEGSAPFFQCEHHESYHGAMEYAISEFEEVVEIEKGLFQGRHIVTNLWNFAMPFIRFDTQDYVEWREEPCSCGRKLLNVTRIVGRDNDVLVTPKGKKLIVHIFTIFFSKQESVIQFQVVQNSPDILQLNLIVKDSYNTEKEAEILTYWKDIIDDEDVSIELKLVDKIEPSKSGKRRFLIRNF